MTPTDPTDPATNAAFVAAVYAVTQIAKKSFGLSGRVVQSVALIFALALTLADAFLRPGWTGHDIFNAALRGITVFAGSAGIWNLTQNPSGAGDGQAALDDLKAHLLSQLPGAIAARIPVVPATPVATVPVVPSTEEESPL